MIIGLDFDRVLFDTDSFDEYYKENVEGLEHVEANVYDENGNYNPEKHAEICGIPSENIWKALQNLERFLYNDIELLKELSDHTLIIVTRGNKKFQERKIKSSNSLKYVDNYKIVEKGPKDQVKIDLLVDDREKELERANIPGVKLSRPQESLKKVISKVEDFEA